MNFPLSSSLLGAGALAIALALPSSQAQPTAKVAPLIVDPTPVSEGSSPRVATYADVLDPVQQAVVSVYSSKTVRQRVQINPLFRQFFGDIPDRESREEGLGSGVIVSSDGYILTNNHVIDGADELNVSLADGREFKAKVIGSDPKTDVAVIKIEAENLPTVVLADSDNLRVGDIVFAVGNPLGIGQTVTMGIVSALGRSSLGLLEGGTGYENFIQTDAAINMGNSGGALIDAKGRLAGINTAIISTTRGNIGIGFAIPVNLASSVMRSLVDTGSVARGYLGVAVDPITADLAEALGLKKDARGVIITNVQEGSPAAAADLKRGDAVLAINGRNITSIQDLRLLISQLPPSTEVQIRYVRDGKERTIKVKLGQLDDHLASTNEILPGVTVSRVNDEIRRRLNLDNSIDGLLVETVTRESPYGEWLLPNMVVLEINGSNVTDAQSAKAAIIPGRNLFWVYYRGRAVPLPITVK